ncbi:MAG: CotH kinase family protein [Bacilli bacterium]|nr:CotH kinase family protein [Bacilli bacterium]
MKKKSKLLPLLCVPFLLAGCGATDPKEPNNPGENGGSGEGGNNGGDNGGEGGQQGGGNTEHIHTWGTEWSKDQANHWHECTDSKCTERNDSAAHVFSDWIIDSYATDETREVQNQFGWGTTTETYKKEGSQHRDCTICGYRHILPVTDYKPEPSVYTPKFNRQGYHIFDKAPTIKFQVTDDTKGGTSTEFATKPNKSKGGGDPWEVKGKYIVDDLPGIDYDIGEVTGGMKVRGNYTTDYAKKGFRIKFDAKQNLFGLNNGKKFKKWVLFADVKDTSMLRNAVSFFMAREMGTANTFCTDFTPVHLYINNQYWGLYQLAEQKEAKEGRIPVAELPNDNYTGVDIGYTFELDKYASEEAAKGLDGDPTFTVQYKPAANNKSHSGENRYNCNGDITTYTLLTDVGPRDAVTKSNDQVNFIKNRVEQLYEILYRAVKNQGARDIVNDVLVNSSETNTETLISKYFDINTFVDSYILNEVCTNPDIGYSSFYLSYDNSATGDKKLRLDNPWDFDTALGIRQGTVENAQGLFASESSNMWINLMSKFSWFQTKVKARWNELREAKLFERALDMIEDYAISYKSEYAKNFAKWTSNMGSNPETSFEVRRDIQKFKTERECENQLYEWMVQRVDYLETVFGSKRGTCDIRDGSEGPVNPGTTDYSAFKTNANKVRVEAETGSLNGNCTVKSASNEGISGDRYVSGLNPNGGSVTMTYNSTKATQALLTVGLSARTADYNLTDLFDITINGTAFSSDASIPGQSGDDNFHKWTSVDAGMINLKSGSNTIVFTAKQNSTNFDYIDMYIPK